MSKLEKFGVSQPVRRVEDKRFLTGQGSYMDDQTAQGALRAFFLRSPVAHGAIIELDAAAAREAPGVRGVFLAGDLEAIGANELSASGGMLADGARGLNPGRPVLAGAVVRHVGEAIAMVVADTLAQAKDAAELIEFDIEARAVVTDTAAATAPGAPLVFEDAQGNLALEAEYGADAKEVDAALAAADRVVTLELINNRVVSNPMETRGALAEWDEAAGVLTMETGAQGVWTIRNEIADRLGMPSESVRVTTGDVGGGFGTKSFPYPEQVAVAFAARALKASVKWVAERSEGFLSDAMGRDHVTTARAGFDAERRLVALKVDTTAAMGAYQSPFAAYIPTGCASKVLPGVYDLQAASYTVRGVFTHTTPVDAYRGAGRPEAIYVIERLMDVAAKELGVDPVALRRKSYIPAERMPYTTAVGELYDTGDFDHVTTAALEKADVAGFAGRKAATERQGRLRGLGYCYYIESILGAQEETAKIDLAEDGGVDLYVGVQSNGQGHETAFAQILHQRCGLPFERIRLVQGDSARIAKGGGTGGSRSVTMQGAAINVTADALVEQLRPLAEEELEAASADIEFRDGAYWVVGTDRAVDLITLGAKARASGRAALAMAEETNVVPGRSFPNGMHVAEVEIDPRTGETRLVKYTMVDDFGVLINPMLAEGQAQGGVVQGLGQVLMEFVAFDEDGQLQTGSFMDYAMPRAADAPALAFHSEPTPSTANPIGMKGCGEAGSVGALAAVTNAALDALWPLGVRHIDMPLTPQRVWSWIAAVAGRDAA